LVQQFQVLNSKKLVSGSRPDDHNKDSFGSFVYNIPWTGDDKLDDKNTTKWNLMMLYGKAKIMQRFN
jgi:hypothetical protein